MPNKNFNKRPSNYLISKIVGEEADKPLEGQKGGIKPNLPQMGVQLRKKSSS